MSDRYADILAEGVRLEIEPEPSDEELVAIMQVLRELQEADSAAAETGPASNWERIARREALRPAEWPTQRLEWSAGRR